MRYPLSQVLLSGHGRGTSFFTRVANLGKIERRSDIPRSPQAASFALSLNICGPTVGNRFLSCPESAAISHYADRATDHNSRIKLLSWPLSALCHAPLSTSRIVLRARGPWCARLNPSLREASSFVLEFEYNFKKGAQPTTCLKIVTY